MTPSYYSPESVITERLPGEPSGQPLAAPLLAGKIALHLVLIGVLATLAAPLTLPYLVGVLIAGQPPTAMRPAQAFYYLGLIWWIGAPGQGPLGRLWLTMRLLRKFVCIPFAGLAWFLDDLIFGRELAAVRIEAPVIKISAARSGSTQLARYIEGDPGVIAPSVLQIVHPYLWLWRLVTPLARRFVDPDWVRRRFIERLPAEFVERHEGDPLRTDTFEVGIYLHHMNVIAPFLGAEAIAEEFSMAATNPSTRRLWTDIFADYFDGVARKTIAFAGPAAAGRRYFAKGHFLASAETLARRYPDGRFLTMIRPPARRLQSMVNFLWCNPIDEALGKIPWPEVAEGIARAELVYNAEELAWFTKPDGPRRCVLRFTDYVRDLEGTMRKVYRECLDTDELPAHVPTEHEARERKNYSVDRSLPQLGLDGAAYEAAQPAFVAWCRGEDPPPG